MSYICPPGVTVHAPYTPSHAAILSCEALQLLATLTRAHGPAISHLLAERQERQTQIDAGALPDFLPETQALRQAKWHAAPIPPDLLDRRVEITGPASDRKMVINALNSGASAFMADFEDANSPTWENSVQGQINLIDAVRRDITYTSPDGKPYRLCDQPAVLIVRPRGWHLVEGHIEVDGLPMPAALVDAGLYLFHNAHELITRGSGPYLYLPKLESHQEARVWDQVLCHAEALLGLTTGTVKVTVLVETLLAAFEIDEIIYALRDRIVGMNCGRWDYLFSYIKKLRHHAFLLPDRAQVTMTSPCMRAYSLLTIETCHRRGILAIGGMAAQIPVKGDPVANERALALVRSDKEREASDGHDGTWVAHPALVSVAREVFDRLMPASNQVSRIPDIDVTAQDLLQAPTGTITERGVRNNVSVAVRYTAAWLDGRGAVPLYNLMEDAATAEIARAQLWQWIHHPQAMMDNGRRVTKEFVQACLEEEMADLAQSADHAQGRWADAKELIMRLTLGEQWEDFLTIGGYEKLVSTPVAPQESAS